MLLFWSCMITFPKWLFLCRGSPIGSALLLLPNHREHRQCATYTDTHIQNTQNKEVYGLYLTFNSTWPKQRKGFIYIPSFCFIVTICISCGSVLRLCASNNIARNISFEVAPAFPTAITLMYTQDHQLNCCTVYPYAINCITYYIYISLIHIDRDSQRTFVGLRGVEVYVCPTFVFVFCFCALNILL